jgi:hypothetical protein
MPSSEKLPPGTMIGLTGTSPDELNVMGLASARTAISGSANARTTTLKGLFTVTPRARMSEASYLD